MNQEPKSGSRHLLLKAIRQHGRMARIDLARVTGISQATVTTVTADMLRQGLIAEHSADENKSEPGVRRGRPRVQLKLRGAAHLVAGVKIANDVLSIVFMDFAGKLLGDYTAPLEENVMAPQVLCDQLKTAIFAAAEHNGLDANNISAVGIGVAGVVDTERGIVHWSPSLTERNVPLQQLVAATIGCPSYVDNDTNLVAVAEMLFGHGVGASEFIVITVESGVGMGIILNGELYRGARGCGAEFGHCKVQLDGALCRCGQRGCLEAYVADYALIREASVCGIETKGNVKPIFDAARDDNAAAKNIITRASRMFSMGIANVINIFDPQLIILAGARMQHKDIYATVSSAVREQIVQVDIDPPEIIEHDWGDLMWAKGAAAYAIDRVAETSLLSKGDHAV